MIDNLSVAGFSRLFARLRRVRPRKILPALAAAVFFAGTAPVSASPERQLFVSVIQQPQTLASSEAVLELIQFARRAGITALFIQIYRGDQAWFSSELADDSPYREALKKNGEDTLDLLIREAHASGIAVHAWLNLLSLSKNTEAPILKKYGPAVLTQKPGPEKNKLEDYLIDNQYFLEPSDPRVHEHLLGILGEVLRAYPGLDGIQADYIRYPDSQPFYGYTPENLEAFRAASGIREVSEFTPGWKDWRRGRVTALVEKLSKRARELRPGIIFSTTGCAPYARAYHEAFQDWARWVELGLADFVTMMSYPLDPLDLEENLMGAGARAEGLSNINVGIGAYKMAAKADIFQKHWQICTASGARGCAVFHYGSLHEDPALAGILLSSITRSRKEL